MKNLYWIQSCILLAGSIFAWFTVYTDFARFYNLYQSFTRIENCIVPNPITTPCFYGAFAFLGAFIWSLFIAKKTLIDKLKHQKRLFILLIGSTIFAWTNLAIEMYQFYLKEVGDKISCSGVETENIFTTPCFIGSMIFFLALIVAYVIKKDRIKIS